MPCVCGLLVALVKATGDVPGTKHCMLKIFITLTMAQIGYQYRHMSMTNLHPL